MMLTQAPTKLLSRVFEGVTSIGELSDIGITDVCLDSRKVIPGALFIAVAGESTDGIKYVSQALEKGAIAVAFEAGSAIEEFINAASAEVVFVPVTNIRKQISRIAGNFYAAAEGDAKIVGVTGTNGKSTIVSLVAQLSQTLGDVAATIGTLGYAKLGQPLTETGMTTPDAVSCQRMLAELRLVGASSIAMEVSSHGIDQHRVASVIFDVAILTNITRDHLDYHGTFEHYSQTKASFVQADNSKAVVINLDDSECQRIANQLSRSGKKVLTYSVHNSEADIYTTNQHFSIRGIEATLHTPWGSSEFKSNLIGEFNLSNLLASIGAACVLSNDFEKVCAAVASLTPVAGRMQRVIADRFEPNSYASVLVDYAHTPDALKNALLALVKHKQNQLWVVFGCGGDRDKGKRPLMGAIAAELADCVVITSDNPRTESAEAILSDIEAGVAESNSASKAVVTISDREAAIRYAVASAHKDDCILIAGKGHEDYQIIGSEKTYFDDYAVAMSALTEKLSGMEGSVC